MHTCRAVPRRICSVPQPCEASRWQAACVLKHCLCVPCAWLGRGCAEASLDHQWRRGQHNHDRAVQKSRGWQPHQPVHPRGYLPATDPRSCAVITITGSCHFVGIFLVSAPCASCQHRCAERLTRYQYGGLWPCLSGCLGGMEPVLHVI